MIYWMGERTNRILDENDIEVVGFDPDRESEDAWISVNIAGYSTVLCLGKVKGLSDKTIERRFAAAILHLAIDFDKENNIFVTPDEVDKVYSIADELLAGDDDVG